MCNSRTICISLDKNRSLNRFGNYLFGYLSSLDSGFFLTDQMTCNATHQLRHETIAGTCTVNYSDSLNHSCIVLELESKNE